MEPISNSTRSCWDRSGNIPKRQSGTTRGSRAKIGRLSISSSLGHKAKSGFMVAEVGIHGATVHYYVSK